MVTGKIEFTGERDVVNCDLMVRQTGYGEERRKSLARRFEIFA